MDIFPVAVIINSFFSGKGRGCSLIIGAHESTAGGFSKAIVRATEDGCRSVQIFPGPPGRWNLPAVRPGEVRDFRSSFRKSDIRSVVVHGRYLVNPAGPDPDIQIPR